MLLLYPPPPPPPPPPPNTQTHTQVTLQSAPQGKGVISVCLHVGISDKEGAIKCISHLFVHILPALAETDRISKHTDRPKALVTEESSKVRQGYQKRHLANWIFSCKLLCGTKKYYTYKVQKSSLPVQSIYVNSRSNDD